MQDFLTWGAIVVAGGSIVAVISFWMNLGARLAKSEHEAATAKEEAKAAHTRYDALMERVIDWRVLMAGDIAIIKTLAEANTASLTAAENRVAKALEEVRDQLGTFNQRVDQLFNRQ